MPDGFGAITWWGFSPSLDLQQKSITDGIKDVRISDKDEDALNVLIVGAGDCRHILKTIALAHRHCKRKINFYVQENNLELYARTLLLMTIALEPPSRMGLQDKTELFLEIYGNSLVRQQSMDYVHKFSTTFIKMVTDFDYLENKMPLIDMSLLKYKERDFLEAIFKFWRMSEKKFFDVALCWDLRIREYLGERYDAIPNVFDWDCSMILSDRGASIINNKQYARWRKEGIAFDLREGTYDAPNKTLASGMVLRQGGERHHRRGYWGDILVSPYITYGIECEEKRFFKKSNNMYTQTAQDVSEYNVLSLFYELTHKEKYVLKEETSTKPDETKEEAKLEEITEEDEEGEEEGVNEPVVGEPQTLPEYEPLPVADFAKIYFLPIGCVKDLHKKSRFNKLFNMVYLSNSMIHLLTADLMDTVRDEASFVFETAKFMIELKQEQCQKFHGTITGIAKKWGLEPSPDNHQDDSIAIFSFSRKESQPPDTESH